MTELHSELRGVEALGQAHLLLSAAFAAALAVSAAGCRNARRVRLTHYRLTTNKALPDGALEKSYRLATQADELWVIGSTLEVMPAASIVPIAAEAGVPITIMNMGRTQYDRLADRLIHDDIAVALPQLVDETITAEQ